MTARWVVEEVVPQRDVTVRWQPISLFTKNAPQPGDNSYDRVWRTHRYLRVMESLRAAEGDGAVQAFYWELARRIHHDKQVDFDVADALRTCGSDPGLAAAFDDDAWDDELHRRMQLGLDLGGDDVGTPILAFDDVDGQRVGLFGPVITRVPSPQRSLQLWDGFLAVATVPGFWELKRTRTERPDVGERP